MPSSESVSDLLALVAKGDSAARERLWRTVYDELRKLAKGQLARESADVGAQATSLVQGAYLRLAAGDSLQWKDRRHFFGAAANAMRQILIDDARRRKRLKRGGGMQPGQLFETAAVGSVDPDQILAIEEALQKLESHDSRRAEVVRLRFFAGLTITEIAQALEVSPRTVDNHWRLARAWLYRELHAEDTTATGGPNL